MRRKSLCGGSMVRPSGQDIKVGAAAHNLERAEAQAAIARAFAGLDVVFIAVPWANEMRFVGGKGLAEPGLVGSQHVLDLGHDDAFAARPALMQAEILVGVEMSLPMEHADLYAFMRHDAPIALGDVRDLADEQLRHFRLLPSPLSPRTAAIPARSAHGRLGRGAGSAARCPVFGAGAMQRRRPNAGAKR